MFARYDSILLDFIPLFLLQIFLQVFCEIQYFPRIMSSSANCFTVIYLTAYKVATVYNPFLIANDRVIMGLTVSSWLLPIFPTLVRFYYKSRIRFNDKYFQCLNDIYVDPDAKLSLTLLVAFNVLLPAFCISVLNSILCVTAVRLRKSTTGSYKALITTCSLSGLFLLSWAPYIMYVFYQWTHPESPFALGLAASRSVYLNCCGNPILYTITNRRFYNYVKQLVTCTCNYTKQGTINRFSSRPTINLKILDRS